MYASEHRYIVNIVDLNRVTWSHDAYPIQKRCIFFRHKFHDIVHVSLKRLKTDIYFVIYGVNELILTHQ